MANRFGQVTILIIAGCVSACSGGGGGGDDDTTPAPLDLFFGAVDDSASGNGRPFEDGSRSIADRADQPFETIMVRTDAGPTRAESQNKAVRATIIPSAAFVDGTGDEITLEIDGEIVTVNPNGVLSDGREVASFGAAIEGDESILISGIIGGDSDAFEVYFAPLGLETPPDFIANDAIRHGGTARYNGTFQVSGVAYFEDGSPASLFGITGETALDADFTDQTVSGLFEGIFPALDTPGRIISGVMDPADIVGNGLTGDIDWTCTGGASCETTSPFGATFMGLEGADVTGVLLFDGDIALGAPIGTIGFVGSGGFIASQR